jgi:hypothetical protein
MEIAISASAGHAIPGTLSDASWLRHGLHTRKILRTFEVKMGLVDVD